MSNNSSYSSATPLSLGVQVTGALSSTTEQDYFTVTLATGGVLQVDFKSPVSSSNFYFDVAVYDSSFTNTLAEDILGASTSFSLGVQNPGTYYVTVTSSLHYSTGTYGLTVSAPAGSAGGYEAEPNDTLSTANPVTLGQPIKGQLASSTDVDCYHVKATAPGALVVDFAAPAGAASAGASFTVSVYDANGKLLQSQDSGNAPTLSATVPAAGDYYVKVTQGNGYDGGNYSLTVHNDGYAAMAAKTLAGSGSVPLQLSAGHDWYAVNLVAGTTYEFGLAGSTSGGGTLADPSLSLCYSNGTSLENCDNLSYYDQVSGVLTNTKDPQLAFTAPKTGTYYLLVGGNGGTGSYTLNEKTDTAGNLVQSLVYHDSVTGAINDAWNAAPQLGKPVTLTYCFLSSADTAIVAADGESNFVAMNSTQQTIVENVLLHQYGAVADITFVPTSDPAAADIRFGTSTQANSAGITHTTYSNGVLTHADVYIDYSSGTLSFADGSYSLETLIHETGHALGLKHPGNYDALNGTGVGPYLPAPLDNREYTDMSYVDNPDSAVYESTPGLLDIAAVQTLYGANTSGTQAQTFQFSNSTAFNTALLGSGTLDTIDLSNQSTGATLFLTPGTLSSIGVGANGGAAHDNVAIPFGESVANVVTGTGNDLIVGNALDNKFFGFSVGDTIDGGGGNNTLVLTTKSPGPGLGAASDSQLQNIQTVDATGDVGGTIDLHNQSEIINIEVGPGNDTIVGGIGRDVLVLPGSLKNYSLANAAASGYTGTVSAIGSVDTGSTDTVNNIERFQFSDVKLAFDTGGSAGNTAKLIAAAFGTGYLSNTPADDAIKGQGIAIFDAGTTMQQLSAAIVNSAAFVGMEGTNSNLDFVNFIFKNVIGQAPTTNQANYLLSYLNNGMTQGDFLATVANLDLNVDLVGLAGKGLEYV